DSTAIGEFIIVLCSESPPPVQSLAPWVPAEIAKIVEDALQIHREQRYESAEAMLEAIRALLPNGEKLRVEEIAPFDERVRAGASVPPRALSTQSGGSGSRARSELRSPQEVTSSGAATLLMPPGRTTRPCVGARKNDSATPNPVANTQIEPVSPPRRRTLPLAIGIGAAILGGLAFGLSQGTQLFSDRPATSATSTTAVTGGPAPSASSSATRQANLVILPDDALVEIDSVPTSPVGGIVKVTGAVGSTHRVRISKDGQEKITDVLIGPSGAEPPKVELVMLAAPGATAETTTKPAVGSRLPPKRPTAPGAPSSPTPARNPLIPERFE
ncbi:MAG: hypothetical protein ABI134_16840, partial [Byssovorax sp.]